MTATYSPQAIEIATPSDVPPADPLAIDPGIPDIQPRPVDGEPSPQARQASTSIDQAPADPLAIDHPHPDTHIEGVDDETPPQARVTAAPRALTPADLLAIDQPDSDTYVNAVDGDLFRSPKDDRTPSAVTAADAIDQKNNVNHSSGVDGEPSPQAIPPSTTTTGAPADVEPAAHGQNETQEVTAGWLELRIWSEQYFDVQQARIAAVNRAERGGVEPSIYEPYLDSLILAENFCEKMMIQCYRRITPADIVAWQKREKGLGDKLVARLLGHLGHPCAATPHHWEGSGAQRVLLNDEPFLRSVGQLWQYCGHGDPHRRKHKGMTAEEAAALGNPTLKMLVHLIAECCMKTNGHYRDVYDDLREIYMERVHVEPCVRCGPSGKPAAEGSAWSKGHQHAAALRKVGKEILRDLYHAGMSSVPNQTQHTT